MASLSYSLVIGSRFSRQVQCLLEEEYGIPGEVASRVAQTFLRNFRKCPESLEVPLDDWRHLLWKSALGDQHESISGEVYLRWLQHRYQCLAPSEDVLNLLRSLQKQYCLALITNGPSKSQWEKIHRLQLGSFFQCILVSGDLPWEKPNKKIFLEACALLRVPPEECIMVGDKIETDIVGAAKASLGGSVWVPLGDAPSSATLGTRPDFIVTDVTELSYLLPRHPQKAFGPRVRRLLAPSDPDFEDCNSNSSDGS